MTAISNPTPLKLAPSGSDQFARESSPAYQEAQKVRRVVEWNSRQKAKVEALRLASAKMQATTEHIKDAETFSRWRKGPWARMMAAYRAVEPWAERDNAAKAKATVNRLYGLKVRP